MMLQVNDIVGYRTRCWSADSAILLYHDIVQYLRKDKGINICRSRTT